MPDSTVQQSGGDFTTFNAALQDVGTVNGDTITIQGPWTIDDTAAATVSDDNITGQIVAGNESYHKGFYDESKDHYRQVVSDGNHCITVDNPGFTLDGVPVVQGSAGTSDEGIRIAVSSTTTTFKRCIIFSLSDTSDQDGIFAGNLTTDVDIETCIIYRWGRAGIHSQVVFGGETQNWAINSCSIFDCTTFIGAAEDDGGGISMLATDDANTEINCDVFNSFVFNGNVEGSSADYNSLGSTASLTWGISFSIDSDNSIATEDGGGVGNLANRAIRTSTAGGDEVLVVNLTDGTQNLLLVDDAVNNDAQDAHSATSAEGLTLPILDIEDDVRNRAAEQIDIGADSVPDVPDNLLPEYGQRRAAIGDPPVYGATIVRS